MSVGAKRARKSKPIANQPARRSRCFARPISNCSMSLNVVGSWPSAGVSSQAAAGEVCGIQWPGTDGQFVCSECAGRPARNNGCKSRGSSARTVLCGGRAVMRVPTAIPDSCNLPPPRDICFSSVLPIVSIQVLGGIFFHHRIERSNAPPITTAPRIITGSWPCIHHGWTRSGKNINGNTTQMTPYAISICSGRLLRRIAPIITIDTPKKNSAPAAAKSNSNKAVGASNKTEKTAATNASTPPTPGASNRNSLVLLANMRAVGRQSYVDERHQPSGPSVKRPLTSGALGEAPPNGSDGSPNRRILPPGSGRPK
jgi:hypothetical protein